jgi:hypothetical protein
MINEIIELLPSADLRARIKETGHQFKELELFGIIYRFAPTFDSRINLMDRFSGIASPDAAALARAYIEYEKECFDRFTKATEVFVYELHVKEYPEAYDERYLCSSYSAALACIDRFYEEYAELDAAETEKAQYTIVKRKLFSDGDEFEEDTYAEVVLGPGKTVLEVWDHKKDVDCPPDVTCFECKEICAQKFYGIPYPCFAHDRAVVRYRDGNGRERYGVCLCSGNGCDRMVEEFYIVPLDCSAMREHRFLELYDHDHVEAPFVSLTSIDELDETMRKNYFDFVAYLDEQNEADAECERRDVAVCDGCGSEYLASSSKMASLCPECAHVLYGYEKCNHVFKDGKCVLCLWDGSRSTYIAQTESEQIRKEIEINGCVEIPAEMTVDEFLDDFIEFLESKGCYFGGGFQEIVDGYYILPDGSKGKRVSED